MLDRERRAGDLSFMIFLQRIEIRKRRLKCRLKGLVVFVPFLGVLEGSGHQMVNYLLPFPNIFHSTNLIYYEVDFERENLIKSDIVNGKVNYKFKCYYLFS